MGEGRSHNLFGVGLLILRNGHMLHTADRDTLRGDGDGLRKGVEGK